MWSDIEHRPFEGGLIKAEGKLPLVAELRSRELYGQRCLSQPISSRYILGNGMAASSSHKSHGRETELENRVILTLLTLNTHAVVRVCPFRFRHVLVTRRDLSLDDIHYTFERTRLLYVCCNVITFSFLVNRT